MFVVGINGKAGDGKDTVADMLAKLIAEDGGRSQKYSFAEPIKHLAAYLFDMTSDDMNTYEGKLRTSEKGYALTNRKILQLLGTECFREVFDENMWIDFAQRYIENNIPENNAVLIPDVRFENEAQWVIQNGILLRVIMPSKEEILESSHASEAGFSTPVDMTIVNDGTLDDLEGKVRHAYRFVKGARDYIDTEEMYSKQTALEHLRNLEVK